ncbi:hypothetical protein PGT21_008120 [Puccinia graminis f. sp. tritici]|uniref:Uncharacterized protein n=1 Tax=Puccinia graminis f. sp. tritici TaxID=56615 RepID=A0A5B0MCC5_PUCGR|nr:hypothetical protein PGT21_008120 [Puccinia graminis f. sp. tritici]
MLLSIQLTLVLHFFTFLSMSLVDENPNAKLGTAPQSQIIIRGFQNIFIQARPISSGVFVQYHYGVVHEGAESNVALSFNGRSFRLS